LGARPSEADALAARLRRSVNAETDSLLDAELLEQGGSLRFDVVEASPPAPLGPTGLLRIGVLGTAWIALAFATAVAAGAADNRVRGPADLAPLAPLPVVLIRVGAGAGSWR
jgi:hypothetical protein